MAQEGAGAGVPIDRELCSTGAQLDLANTRVGVAVPPRIPAVSVPIEAEARQDERRLRDGPGKVELEARGRTHSVHHQQPIWRGMGAIAGNWVLPAVTYSV